MSDRLSVMKLKKGFTIVELAVVLVLVGILISLGVSMIGPLTKRARESDTKGTIDAAIESLVGFAATNHRLPTVAEFTGAVKKPNDAWGNALLYVVDTNLTTIPAGSTDTICGRKATNLTVRSCVNAGCTTFTDTPNTAYIIFSGGANVNNQIAATGAVAAATTVNIYDTGLNVDNYAGDLGGARVESFDDITRWVTLNELRTKAGCTGQQLKILNNELPSGSVTASYGSNVYGDRGIPFTAGGSYRWCLQTATGVIAADLPGFTVTPNVVNINCQGLAEGTWGQANNLQLSKPAGSGTAGSYSVMVFVRDNADTAGTNDNIASRAFVITVSP
jgi:prepilin-type N-terminal cleavage/methylation domain-containing protein